MSMMARFIAVSAERLDQLKRSPEDVEALFAPAAGHLPFDLSPLLQERLRRQAPQMLGGMLGRMPPELREQLMRRLGISEADLGGAGLGDAILKRMAERRGSLRPPLGATAAEPLSVSLDKAWHGLHYLLCGAAEPMPGPLGQAVLGGKEIGDDQGYGPARCFTPAETAQIAKALAASGLEDQLHARFDPAAMEKAELYPGGWGHEGDDWLIDAFRKLRDFYGAASAAGQAVVTVIE